MCSSATIVLPNGKPYENTHSCWKYLGRASADARYLDLVPAGAFVDRRAPEPIVYIPDDEDSEGSIGVCNDEPSIAVKSTELLLHYEPQQYSFPELPDAVFIPPKLAEPYAIEIWIEKSTVNAVLLPLAQRHGFTLVTGVGEARSAYQNPILLTAAIERFRAPKRQAMREITRLARDIQLDIMQIRDGVIDAHVDEVADLQASFEQAQVQIAERQAAIAAAIAQCRRTVEKRRPGPNGEEFGFHFKVVDLGTDKNGEPVTTLVIEWASQPLPPGPAPKE
jgi:hypothetical protein